MRRNLRAGVVLLVAGAVMVVVTTRDRGPHPTADSSQAAALLAAAGTPVGWDQPRGPLADNQRRQLIGGVQVGFTGDMARYTDVWVEFASPPVGPDAYETACRAANAYLGRVSDLLGAVAPNARLVFEPAACLARLQQAASERTVGTVIVWSDGITTDTKARYVAAASVADQGRGGPQLLIGVGYAPS